jgi:hypothetical protein
MTINRESEPLAEHPLFRALVLMGGGLALGCGGVAQVDGHGAESGGPATSTASANGGNAGSSNAGSGNASAPITLGQTAGSSSGGRPSIDVDPPLVDACPVPQWDCSQLAPSCMRDLTLGWVQLGCTCDPTRPLSAKDCAPEQSLFCQRGFGPFEPDTWDYSIHYQCSCGPTPPGNVTEAATDTCLQITPGARRSTMIAYLPATETCDGTVCTATSADVLRQDGIMCGCADIGLK